MPCPSQSSRFNATTLRYSRKLLHCKIKLLPFSIFRLISPPFFAAALIYSRKLLHQDKMTSPIFRLIFFPHFALFSGVIVHCRLSDFSSLSTDKWEWGQHSFSCAWCLMGYSAKRKGNSRLRTIGCKLLLASYQFVRRGKLSTSQYRGDMVRMTNHSVAISL